MDPIIGEFTITSGSDPAIFHTTFARAINLDEGYELGLKSIYHGPVNNLVFPKFILRSEGKPGLYHMSTHDYCHIVFLHYVCYYKL